MINHVFAAAGSEEENTKSTAPAEKQKPARKPRSTVTVAKIPYNAEYTTNNGNAANMKPNSNGSVTPQINEQTAADTTKPIAAFLFLAV